jgi:photosystem II stability/assembly factor-like uncharacterized protein
LFWALALLPAGAFAARPQVDSEPAERTHEVIERDDPLARREFMRQWRGEDDPAAQWRILQEARKERDHYGASQPGSLIQQFAAVPGSVFINVGPTRADLEVNGAKYYEIDSGRARQIIPHPTNPSILYMSTSGGGVWKTFDGGAGWEPVTDFLGTLAVGTLAMDPSSPEVLYLGFGDPFDVRQPGIVQSRDGGATWSNPIQLVATYSLGGINYTFTASSVTDIKIDPTNSQIVLVATNHGFFRSIDAGNTYTQIHLNGPAGEIYNWMWSIAYVGPHTWLATSEKVDVKSAPESAFPGMGTGLGLWRSTDDGATWSLNDTGMDVANFGRTTLSAALSTVNDAKTARIFMVAGTVKGDATKDVYRSEDGGKTFLALGVNSSGRPTNPNVDQPDLNIMNGQAWYNQDILVDPTNPDTVYVGGNLAMIRSTNGGQTWSIISDWLPAATGVRQPYVHADFHAFAMGVDGNFYAGTDGGIFLSANAQRGTVDSVTFTSQRNVGLVTHLIYNVACAPETWPADMQGWMAGGLQDNGTRVRKGATTTFDQLLGGDGFGLAVSAGATNGVPNTFMATVEFSIYKSTDGGTTWTKFDNRNGIAYQLPFNVKVVRDEAATDPDTYLTFVAAGSTTPAVMYRSVAGADWSDISGSLKWQDTNTTVSGFTTVNGTGIGLRNVAAHAKKAGVYGAVSNRYAYVTADNGANWLASLQPRPPGSSAGNYLLSSVALDLSDTTGQTYYVTSRSMQMIDDANKLSPLPDTWGHLFKTTNGGLSWTPLGAKPVAQGGLPFVPISVVKIDPNATPTTLYVGTDVGLYRSTDGGNNFSRFGAGSMPLVEVTDFCIAPASSRLTASTYGRGFWQISTDASTNPAGVKGRGDTNFDLRVDGQDLIDLADAWGSTQASPLYRYQADLVGTVNAVDNADLTALLAKFGGQP